MPSTEVPALLGAPAAPMVPTTMVVALPAVQVAPTAPTTMVEAAAQAVAMGVELPVAIIPHHPHARRVEMGVELPVAIILPYHVQTVRRNVPLYVKGSRLRHVQIVLQDVLRVVETTVTIHARACVEESVVLHAVVHVKENVGMALAR